MPRPSAKEPDVFWEKFEQFQDATAGEPAWLTARRKAALSQFADLGFPTTKDEDWRFTNVAPIAKLPFHPVLSYEPGQGNTEAVRRVAFARHEGPRLVFIDGHFSPELSRSGGVQGGIRVSNLNAALSNTPELLEHYFHEGLQDGRNAFLALNTAFFTDGALIYLPEGRALREPVELLHIATRPQAGSTAHIRHIIVAEKGSSVTVLEKYASLTDTPHVTNVCTELFAGEGATVEHCKFQDEATSAFHMAAINAQLGRQSNVIAHSFALGSRLSRNSIRTVLAGEGIECILNGLYLTRDDQLADHHMIVEHARPHCNSHEYFNGILDGKSKGVFHGRILVRPEAQKTDAKQTNKNLLLSDDASIDTKPQLEIYADDVKCTHGATIGQLNEESVFYLRARGISRDNARRMLMHAFAGEIIDRVRHEPVREELDRLVRDRLEQNERIAVPK